MDARTLLEECIRTAKEQYSDVKAELADAIQKEIARDLWALQMQPAVMDEYRRLVVVKSKSSDRYFTEDKEGVSRCILVRYESLFERYRLNVYRCLNSTSKMPFLHRRTDGDVR